MKKVAAIILFIVSLALLVPGLNYPMLSISATVEKAELIEIGVQALLPESDNSLIGTMIRGFVQQLKLSGTIQVYDKTRSVLGAVEDLLNNQHYFVAFLIGFFAVVVPIIKALLLLLAMLLRPGRLVDTLLRFSALIGKWSMVDVYVIAIAVSYLAFNAWGESGGLIRMHAEFGNGFFFFSGYCIVSILAAQLMASSRAGRQ